MGSLNLTRITVKEILEYLKRHGTEQDTVIPLASASSEYIMTVDVVTGFVAPMTD